MVTEAAAEKTEIDREMVKRVTVTLDAAQVAWSRFAQQWGELASPGSRPIQRLLAPPARSERQ